MTSVQERWSHLIWQNVLAPYVVSITIWFFIRHFLHLRKIKNETIFNFPSLFWKIHMHTQISSWSQSDIKSTLNRQQKTNSWLFSLVYNQARRMNHGANWGVFSVNCHEQLCANTGRTCTSTSYLRPNNILNKALKRINFINSLISFGKFCVDLWPKDCLTSYLEGLNGNKGWRHVFHASSIDKLNVHTFN